MGLILNPYRFTAAGGLPYTTNLDFWWDPSDTSTLTLSGSDVENMADLSGNGNTLSFNGTTGKPVTGATQNGLNALDCYVSSSGRSMTRATPTHNIYTNQAITVVAAFEIDTSPSNNCVFCLLPYTTQDHQGVILDTHAGTVRATYGDGQPISGTSNLVTKSWTLPGGSFVQFRVLTWRIDTSAVTCRLDGSDLGAPSSSGGTLPQANFLNNAAGNLQVAWGSRYHSSGFYPWNSNISGEMVVYSEYLSDANVGSVEDYLMAKWGV